MACKHIALRTCPNSSKNCKRANTLIINYEKAQWIGKANDLDQS